MLRNVTDSNQGSSRTSVLEQVLSYKSSHFGSRKQRKSNNILGSNNLAIDFKMICNLSHSCILVQNAVTLANIQKQKLDSDLLELPCR